MKITYSQALTLVGQMVEVDVDRPMGSKHPTHGYLYPINYGFIAGIPAPDGDDLDAYVLGVFEPVDRFSGQCIALIRRAVDDDDKLVVVPEGKDYSDEQILALTEFQEGAGSPSVLRSDDQERRASN